MNHSGHAQSGHCSKIRWGAIIAGAAIVAGAVLFAPGVMQQIPNIFQGIGSLITGLLHGAPAAGTHVGTKLVEVLGSETAKKVAGAALMGGGITYFMSGKKDHQIQPNPEAAESFAMREDMRKMQSLMVMRAAYAGNPQAQAMLAQQGRA